MGDAADDLYNAAMREEERQWTLRHACTCDDPHWEQDPDDGLWECLECGAICDE